MSQIDAEKIASPEGQENNNTNPKLIDVSEAIKYRKRAQSAEQKQEQLQNELEKSNGQVEMLNKKIGELETEKKLIEKLAQNNSSDIEAAVIIGKEKIRKTNETDLDRIVEELKTQKAYLFTSVQPKTAADKTNGVREKLQSAAGILEKNAKKAIRSGSRADLQEYLRIRRNFI